MPCLQSCVVLHAHVSAKRRSSHQQGARAPSNTSLRKIFPALVLATTFFSPGTTAFTAPAAQPFHPDSSSALRPTSFRSTRRPIAALRGGAQRMSAELEDDKTIIFLRKKEPAKLCNVFYVRGQVLRFGAGHGVSEMNEYLGRQPYGSPGFKDPGVTSLVLLPHAASMSCVKSCGGGHGCSKRGSLKRSTALRCGISC